MLEDWIATVKRSYLALRRRGRARGARASEEGYSLLEVLIVLTIIALIAVLVGPRLLEQLDRSKVTAARVQIRSLISSLETMRLDIGRYPTGPEGLDLLVKEPADPRTRASWRGPYLDGEVPADPWGGAYTYKLAPGEGARPVISSLGSDGKEGGEGLAADIRNGGKP